MKIIADNTRRHAKLTEILAFGLVTLVLSGCAKTSSSSGGGGGGNGGGGGGNTTLTLTNATPYQVPGGINWVVAGVGGFSLLTNGTGFTSTSVVEWNGSPLPTQFGTSINLAATVSSTLVATPGTVSITIYDSSTGTSSGSLSFGIASAAAATAGVVQMITVAPDGTPANGNVYVKPSISSTGRYIAFQSDATNLGAGVAGSWAQIYERDTCIGAPSGCVPSTIPITITYDGSAPSQNSRTSSISGDGRYVTFDSSAGNILANSAICSAFSGDACVYVRDTCIGASSNCQPSTRLVSSTVSDNPADGGSPSISFDGRFVGYNSTGTSPGINNIYLNDTCTGAAANCTPVTTLCSQSTSEVQGNQNSYSSAVSTGGRFVIFESYSTNLIPNDTDIYPDIFLRDTCIGAASSCVPSTTIESLGLDGAFGNDGLDFEVVPSVSSTGRYLAFASNSTNMVAQNVTVGSIYERDTCFGAAAGCVPTTSLVSVGNDGSLPNGGTNNQSMSADGRYIAFASLSSNLVPGDTFPVNGWKDIFVRDTCVGAPTGCAPSTVRVSVANQPPNITESNGIADYPQISADGHYVVFMSERIPI